MRNLSWFKVALIWGGKLVDFWVDWGSTFWVAYHKNILWINRNLGFKIRYFCLERKFYYFLQILSPELELEPLYLFNLLNLFSIKKFKKLRKKWPLNQLLSISFLSRFTKSYIQGQSNSHETENLQQKLLLIIYEQTDCNNSFKNTFWGNWIKLYKKTPISICAI